MMAGIQGVVQQRNEYKNEKIMTENQGAKMNIIDPFEKKKSGQICKPNGK